MEYDINFSPWQNLPPGYKIQWWECTEHYHWVIDSNVYSEIYACRWHARRAAWRHYNNVQYQNDLKNLYFPNK